MTTIIKVLSEVSRYYVDMRQLNCNDYMKIHLAKYDRIDEIPSQIVQRRERALKLNLIGLVSKASARNSDYESDYIIF